MVTSFSFVSVADSAGASLAPDPSNLQVTLPSQFVGCNPLSGKTSDATNEALSLVLPEAFFSQPNGTVEQAPSFLKQAEVQSLSPLVIQYTILSSARWIDDRVIGVRDFVATWKFGASGQSATGPLYRSISSIKQGSSPNQVLVKFTTPTSDWRSLFSPLLPATATVASGTTCLSPTTEFDLSGGPYVIAASSPNSLLLIRNPNWWGITPTFVTLSIDGGGSPSPDQFTSSGSLGLSEFSWIPQTALTGITSSPGVSSQEGFSNALLSLDFNTTAKGKVPLSIRQAVADLLNRTQIEQRTVGQSDPSITPAASHLLSQGQPGYKGSVGVSLSTASSTTSLSSRSLALARTALHRSGYTFAQGRWTSKTGIPLTFSLSVPLNDHWALVTASQVKNQFAKQGIGLAISFAGTSQSVATNLRTSKTQLGLIERLTSPFPAQSAKWFSIINGESPSSLWAGFTNKGINSQTIQASKDMNPTDANPIYQSIDSKLWVAMPSLPLFTEPLIVAWSSGLESVTPNPFPPGTLSELLTWSISLPSEANASG